jgi:hypothetical protein
MNFQISQYTIFTWMQDNFNLGWHPLIKHICQEKIYLCKSKTFLQKWNVC